VIKFRFGEIKIMTKKAKIIKEIKIERPERMKLSAEESLKRTKEFDKRKEKFIATIRQGKN
jgi:F0F1-type ATP synthase epsilon subunit